MAKFATILTEAVDVAHRLHRLEGSRKLTAGAFLRSAQKLYGGITDERVIEVEATLDRHAHLEAAQQFIRVTMAELRKPNYPSPPRDPQKALRLFGRAETGHQLASIGVTPSEALCAAIARLGREQEDAFGPVDDPAWHQQAIDGARKKLSEYYERLRDGYSAQDVVVDNSRSTQSDKDRGLTRLVFVAYPEVSLAATDWPEQLVRAALARAAIGDAEAVETAARMKTARELAGDEPLAHPLSTRGAVRRQQRRKVLSSRAAVVADAAIRRNAPDPDADEAA
jgi:hypothetical protein